jgi:1A family penicillin-binding protein
VEKIFSKIRYFFILVGHPVYWITWSVLRKLRKGLAKKHSLKSVFKWLYLKNKPIKIHKNHRFSFRPFFLLLVFGLLFFVFSIWLYVFKELPSPDLLSTRPIPLTTHIRDRNGNELYKIYRQQNRTLIQLKEIPLTLRQATIAIEDKSFYSHAGFSLEGIVRAFIRNISSEQQEGGSTITQQLVKTALLSPERTLRRKIKEVVLSIWTETKYSKDQILEMYLNQVNYGGAAYGAEEASQTYFGIPAKSLSLAQATLLAGLPASPTTYSPHGSRPELARQRQKLVLKRMAEEKYVTWEQAQKAYTENVVIAPPKNSIIAPHFVMYVKDFLAQKYGTDLVEHGGLDVITSLDLSIQEETQKIVTNEIAKIAYLRIGNGAALITNPQTGEILAMVGSKDYFDLTAEGNVNVTLSLRQPGSSIKPINYALAFSKGYSPSSVVDDSPITYKSPNQPNYSPINYDGKFHGKVTLRTALGSSYNIPAVKILASNGVENMIDFGTKMGITTWTDKSRFGLSLTLGGGEVTMLDLSTAYGTFANQGEKVQLNPVLKVVDSKGKILEENTRNKELVLDPQVAFLISDVLSDNAARTPAFGPWSDLYIPGHQVAVKTGTTNNLKDNWTIGYTPSRLVAVWVGNNDGSPMSYVASGVTGASPIWRKIMNFLLQKQAATNFTPPEKILKLNICTITGQLACDGCPNRIDYFVEGTQPTSQCDPNAIRKYLEERDKLLNGAKIER